MMAKTAVSRRRWRPEGWLLAAAFWAGGLHPSAAVTLFQKSVFTTIDRKVCMVVPEHPGGNGYLCPGLDGFPVYMAEGDGRTYVAASTDPVKSKAASQTLASFNTPFPRDNERATVEWRFTIKDKRKVPFAMIVRHFTHTGDRRGEVLIVSRIAGTEACHVAYIDALANRDAIVLARNIADTRARKFDCRDQPSIEGETGASPM